MRIFEDKKKEIDGQLYWHYSLLKNWETNSEARLITNENWLKLLADIKRNGIKDSFKIDDTGIVYDGNNRLHAIQELITEGITHAENKRDLFWIPVTVKHPKSEAEKFDIAASGNEQFAQWNKEWIANHLEEYQDELDISLFNFEFDDPFGYEDIVKPSDEDINNSPVSQSTGEKKVICPNCQHEFIP